MDSIYKKFVFKHSCDNSVALDGIKECENKELKDSEDKIQTSVLLKFMEVQNRGLTKDDLSHYNDLCNWFKSKNELQINLDRLLKNK